MKGIIKTLAFAIGMYMSGFMMYVLLFDSNQPEQQEIKVGSVVVLDEEGIMMYCNPMDIIVNGKVTRVDTIWIKYEDVSEAGFKIIKSKVSGINTKDVEP